MGTFTALDDADVTALAAAFAVGAVEAWRPIAAGTINSNFELRAGGARWFLRVNEGKAEADVRYEAAVVTAVAAAGVPTPVPRPAGGAPFARHRGRLVSLFPWIEGVHREAGQVSAADAAAIGRALAGLHGAAAPLARRTARAGDYTHARLIERFADFRGSSDPALAPAIAAIADELAHLEVWAEARAAARAGIIHGDLFRDNVLFGAAGDLVALLDFEQASTGALVYDLAVCVNAWCFDGDVDLPLARALVAGYEQVRPLDPDERALLPTELRAAAMRFTVTRITDVYLPRVALDKDFRRYLRRLERWRELGDAGLLDGSRS